MLDQLYVLYLYSIHLTVCNVKNQQDTFNLIKYYKRVY